jgi:hypothetical protein
VTFSQAYYAYRHSAPIFGPLMGVLVLLLPFVFWTMIQEDVLGMWYRPQHRARHLWGCVGFFGILCIVAFTLIAVRPTEEALVAGRTDEALGRHLYSLHVAAALFNVGMQLQPFFKFAWDNAAAFNSEAAGGAAVTTCSKTA